MTHRVLVSDKLSERGLEVFRAAGPGIELTYRPDLGKKTDELLEVIGDYDAMAIRSGTKVTAEVLERATRLKVVGRAGIGVDNVDLAAASQKGVVVMNTPDGNVVTTAEHAISLMCALSRKIPQATASMRAGKWEKPKFQGREMFQKTLGVIGLGNIGKIVADRANGLRMRVVAFDPFVTTERARELNVELLELDELLGRADIVTLHVPLLDATRNLIDGAAIEKMKPGALLINAARGGLVDEAAVAEAVHSGRLAGAAFDVYSTEPPPSDNPLLGVDGVILTPHLGASTSEAQDNVAVSVAEQIIAFLEHGSVVNAINTPSVPAEVLAALAPYINLGRKLGSFCARLHTDSLRAVRVTFEGSAADLRTDPVSVAILTSVLATGLDHVNEVNAPVVAKERRIEVTEEKTNQSRGFASSIRVTLEGENGATSAVGTLFGPQEARIVALDEMRMEIVPEGHILLTRHNDRPGIIGAVGSALGAGGVNISRLSLGLSESEPDGARAAISIDSEAPEEVLEAIRAIEGINQVHAVHL